MDVNFHCWLRAPNSPGFTTPKQRAGKFCTFTHNFNPSHGTCQSLGRFWYLIGLHQLGQHERGELIKRRLSISNQSFFLFGFVDGIVH